MVEVFKTNVQEAEKATILMGLLFQHFPDSNINFDLEDCDKILRVEGASIMVENIIGLIRANGCACTILE